MELSVPLSDAEKLLNTANQKLLTERDKRIPPVTDIKILTGWNALMIKGMLTAGSVLNEQKYLDSAWRALAYIQHNLWINNRLLATHKEPPAQLYAYLDDYAFLIDALVTSLEVSWNNEHVTFAMGLADTLLKYFF